METEKQKFERANLVFILFMIGMVLLIIFMIYQIKFSKEAQYKKGVIKEFKNCIEEIAENYCNNISKEYKYVYYGGFFDEDYPFINLPSQIICKDYRECCNIERYYFLDDEINKCILGLEIK